MFEKFTDRARKIMQFANQEAQRWNHDIVTAEHILLGVAKESSGVASCALVRLNVDLRVIRLEVEKRLPPCEEMITMGRLPLSESAKAVVKEAIAESKDRNHNYIGTEHILLGILRVPDGPAARVLLALGVTLDGVRREVNTLLGYDSPPDRDADESQMASSISKGSMSIHDLRAFIGRDQENLVKFDRDVQIVRLVAGGLLSEWFGTRCKDFDPDCECCKRWKLLDDMTENPFA